MTRRMDDKMICASVSPDEHALLRAMAAKYGYTTSELIRRSINSLAEEYGDEALFLEPRFRGRQAGSR